MGTIPRTKTSWPSRSSSLSPMSFLSSPRVTALNEQSS
jgi:hypothetical protein